MEAGDRVKFTGTYLNLREELHLGIDTAERIDNCREGTIETVYDANPIITVLFDCEDRTWEVYVSMLELVGGKKQLKLEVEL